MKSIHVRKISQKILYFLEIQYTYLKSLHMICNVNPLIIKMNFGQLDNKTMQNPDRHIFYYDRKGKISLFSRTIVEIYNNTLCWNSRFNPDSINAKLDRK